MITKVFLLICMIAIYILEKSNFDGRLTFPRFNGSDG